MFPLLSFYRIRKSLKSVNVFELLLPHPSDFQISGSLWNVLPYFSTNIWGSIDLILPTLIFESTKELFGASIGKIDKGNEDLLLK